MAHVLPQAVSDATQAASARFPALSAALITHIKTSPVQIGFYLYRVGMRKLLARLDKGGTAPPDEWPEWMGLWSFVTFLTDGKALYYGAFHFPLWLRIALFMSFLEHTRFLVFFGETRPLYDPLYGPAEVRWAMLHCAIAPPLIALSLVYFCPDAPKTPFDWLVLGAYASQSVGWLYFFLKMWPDLRNNIFAAPTNRAETWRSIQRRILDRVRVLS